MDLNQKTLKTLFQLFKQYKENTYLAASEFIEDAPLSDSEALMFLELAKHQRLLEDLSAHFIKNPSANPSNVQVLVYLILFRLDEENLEEIFEFCVKKNTFYLCDLVAGLAASNEHLFICRTACKYFEDAYVLEKIVDPFLNKLPIIIQLGREFFKHHQINSPPTTKPKGFQFLKGLLKKHPHAPANTPAIRARFKASKPPNSTWSRNKSTPDKLLKCQQENRRKAQQLLQEASQVPPRLANPKTFTSSPDKTCSHIKFFKSRTPPAIKEVTIRSNLTTTLREASRVVKAQEEEMKKLEELIKGGCNTAAIEQLEEQLKQENAQKQLEAIERNHLKGLLSHEEALLAKARLAEAIKEKKCKFQEDKEALLQALEQWREAEEQKIRALVEKSQAIKQNAKDSEKKLLQKRQESVRAQQTETKQLMEQVLAEKNKELARKIELIADIKAIQQVRCNMKEFDPTETPNLGLLCEMSIAELQERLAITKMNMKQELEEKRQAILQKKKAHQIMVENVKKLIQESRIMQPKVSVVNQPKYFDSPELLGLRRQLEEKRRLRAQLQ